MESERQRRASSTVILGFLLFISQLLIAQPDYGAKVAIGDLDEKAGKALVADFTRLERHSRLTIFLLLTDRAQPGSFCENQHRRMGLTERAFPLGLRAVRSH